MHTIFTTSTPFDAQLVMNRLLAAGVMAQVVDSDTAFGGSMGGGGQTAVMVADADVARAREVLDAAPMTIEKRPAWQCAGCGEQVEAGFEACWQCGARAPLADEDDGEADGESVEAEGPSDARVPSRENERAASPPPESRGILCLELATVLTIGWLYYFVSAITWLVSPSPDTATTGTQSNLSSLTEWIGAIGSCLLVVLVVARAGGDWARFGLRRPRLLDLALTVLVVAMVVGVMGVYGMVVAGTGVGQELDAMYAPVDYSDLATPINVDAKSGWLLALVFVGAGLSWIVLAAGEEFIFRAYLLPRLCDLWGSAFLSTVVSSLLFASYHAYGGAGHLAYTFVFGLVMACAFWLIRRVWPLVLAHAITNMMWAAGS